MALAALSVATAPTAPPTPGDLIARWVRSGSLEQPRIDIWLNHDDLYHRGDQARVYFKSDRDAYVTVLRIDTDGRLRVLFPIDPWEDNWARGGKTFEVLGRDRDEAFRIDDYPGVGYVFAIASPDPFHYDDLVRGDHWDYRAISDGRVRGDPYVTVSDLAERIAQDDGYDYDVAQYEVEQHYDYPRFLCYDCHSYASWHYWDPYGSSCSRFRIVIYNDWYYYPYRTYGGRRVSTRPYRPGPRYVFKDADARNDYITRVAERPRDEPGRTRQAIERDRTSADVGGRGTIPAPVAPRRRLPEERGRGADDPAGRAPATQPSDRETRVPGDEGSRRRRAEPGSPDNGTVRDLPPASGDEPSRRRPVESQPRTSPEPRGGAREPQASPDRRAPSPESHQGRDRAEPPRDRAEPPRDRAEPPRDRAERPRERAEPKSRPEPKSSGEPQLKRRRPN
jgi:hypothetical protein